MRITSMRSRSGPDVERVRRRHEHHVRQVVVDLEVMVVEGVFCSGSRTSRRRRRRIAAEVHAHLVDLVEQDERVRCLGLAHRLDDLAGHRADIGPPVTADLGLVATPPSDMRTNSRPVARAIDLPSEVLPTPGGPTRQRIGPVSLFARCCTARYSTIRLLDLVKPEMVVVQDLLGAVEVLLDLGALAPRNAEHPVEVVAHDRGLRRHRRHLAELLQLAHRLVAGLLRELGLLDLVLELLEFVARSSSPSSFWIAFICSLR
jgi:hypothetical protein